VLLDAGVYGVGVTDTYERLLHHVGVIEDTGFDSVWIPETHGCAGDPLPAPLAFAAAVAAETSGIRIGVLVKLALEHPVTTCEEAAVLDLLCKGRLLFGADPGGSEREYAGARLGWAQRRGAFREALEIIVQGWTSDGFAYLGELNRLPVATSALESGGRFQTEPCAPPHLRPTERAGLPFDYMSILPKPLQIPRPPVYLLGVDEETIDLAARAGYSLVIPPSTQSAGTDATRYWQVLERMGRHRHEVDLAIARDVYVEADGGRARRRVSGQTSGGLIGTPDEVLHEIKKLQHQTGMRHLLCRVQLPGLTTEQTEASIRLLAEDVRSRLQM
jgi:alkanesulfonate monooxygenase SsuD/methylene tetrahydromethanopterin reductase-like flavin-dependent oxidoreductase (luciferase family)